MDSFKTQALTPVGRYLGVSQPQRGCFLTTRESKMKKDIYQDVTNKIVQEIETGALPWVKEWGCFSGLPENAITGRQYNGINTLILCLMGGELGFASHRWCTYKQARDVNSYVRKGEKSIPVIFYKPLTKDVENALGAMKEITIPMMRVFNVFNLDQLDGFADEPTINATEKLPNIDDFINMTGVKLVPGSPAFVPSMNWVHMPPIDKFETNTSYYATLFHELIHWSGNKTRLDRDMSNRFGDAGYAMEELVAELGAAFLCAKFGVTGEVRHAGYIEHWLKVLKNDNKAIFKAAAEASKAVEYLTSAKAD